MVCALIEWAVFAGAFWLVAWIFGWTFHLGKVTLAWLAFVILRQVFRNDDDEEG